MVKIQKAMTFANAMIDCESNSIIEYDKNGDEVGRFPIEDVLDHWDGIYGITLSIKQQESLPSTIMDGELD